MSTYMPLYRSTPTRILETAEEARRRAEELSAPLVVIVPGASGADGIVDVTKVAGTWANRAAANVAYDVVSLLLDVYIDAPKMDDDDIARVGQYLDAARAIIRRWN